jgi:prophage regulatory protein
MALRLIRIQEVRSRTGQGTTDIYAGMKAGTFPESVPIGVRTVGWVESEVEQWIKDRIARRGEQPKRKGGPGRGHKGPTGAEIPAAA